MLKAGITNEGYAAALKLFSLLQETDHYSAMMRSLIPRCSEDCGRTRAPALPEGVKEGFLEEVLSTASWANQAGKCIPTKPTVREFGG